MSVGDVILQAGLICGALTAVITFCTLMVRSRIGKWVIRNIQEESSERRKADIKETLGEELPLHIGAILAQFKPNGGSSHHDNIMRQFNELRAEMRGNQAVTRAELDAIHKKIAVYHGD